MAPPAWMMPAPPPWKSALAITLCPRYLERNPQLPLGLRQVDPLIRQLTLYRDFIQNKTKESVE
jgi:hypothetical protein